MLVFAVWKRSKENGIIKGGLKTRILIYQHLESGSGNSVVVSFLLLRHI